jgi:hypothetical protein
MRGGQWELSQPPALLMPQTIRVISSTIMMMIRNIASVFFLSR